MLVVVTLACCLIGTIALHGLFGVYYTTPDDANVLVAQDIFYVSTVVLASYGAVSVLGAVISKINISAQPVEVQAAQEEEQRAEEERVIAEYREQKKAAQVIEENDAAQAQPRQPAETDNKTDKADKRRSPQKTPREK